ncbi:MAG: ParB/RepB/Spo0J family partition protein [Myxococcaceae bacterium]
MVAQNQQKRALGRGLSALIPAASQSHSESSGKGVLKLPVEAIRRDGHQPRKLFDETQLKELAESIKAQGILQPVLVRKEGSHYRLIAGERRWRASQLAGLKEIPAIVKDVSEKEAFELALVENLQRADLNPVEEAEGYKRLAEEFRLTQDQISTRVGKDRSTIANALRLLSLPDEVKGMLRDGTLDMGHARALLGVPRIPELVNLARRVAEEKLSVRETERLVKAKKDSGADGKKKSGPSREAKALIEELQRRLGTKVKLNDRGGGKGTLEIEYYSYEDLDRICNLIRK